MIEINEQTEMEAMAELRWAFEQKALLPMCAYCDCRDLKILSIKLNEDTLYMPYPYFEFEIQCSKCKKIDGPSISAKKLLCLARIS